MAWAGQGGEAGGADVGCNAYKGTKPESGFFLYFPDSPSICSSSRGGGGGRCHLQRAVAGPPTGPASLSLSHGPGTGPSALLVIAEKNDHLGNTSSISAASSGENWNVRGEEKLKASPGTLSVCALPVTLELPPLQGIPFPQHRSG